ncbi:MAG: leucyl aminopeptidase family protein, partial [Hyphomonadaceae bacterium]|nr:leucyl aminopeptidase family protein [Hyphomonadaceae bacterium]
MTINHPNLATGATDSAIPIHAVKAADTEAFLATRSEAVRAMAARDGFKGAPGKALVIPGPDGAVERVLFGIGADPMVYGALPALLPEGTYAIASPLAASDATLALTAFLMGCYQFDAHKTKPPRAARLVVPTGADAAEAVKVAGALAWGRTLVNQPANVLGAEALGAACIALAAETGAEIEMITGEELLEQNYGLIHAVGKASAEAPRLAILRWGRQDAPKLALVGKGVVFDSGGLNIKPGTGMALMKKDMGGAACVLTLFKLPIVENAIGGPSFRPGDIITSRKGLTVEIDNTDAEGRLILADALTRASEDGSDLVIDMATLTGAARVALGPELPPFYTDDEDLAGGLLAASRAVAEPVWRMPLWTGYADLLDSP